MCVIQQITNVTVSHYLYNIHLRFKPTMQEKNVIGQNNQNSVWNRSQESYVHNAHISRHTCLSSFHTVASYGPNLTASNDEYQAKWQEHSQAQCHFINHIFHTQYPEDEPRNLQWEVHNLPPQILRLRHVNTKEVRESWIALPYLLHFNSCTCSVRPHGQPHQVFAHITLSSDKRYLSLSNADYFCFSALL